MPRRLLVPGVGGRSGAFRSRRERHARCSASRRRIRRPMHPVLTPSSRPNRSMRRLVWFLSGLVSSTWVLAALHWPRAPEPPTPPPVLDDGCSEPTPSSRPDAFVLCVAGAPNCDVRVEEVRSTSARPGGLRFERLPPGHPLTLLGLRSGDVMMSIDGWSIEHQGPIAATAITAGDHHVIGLWRDGQPLRLTVSTSALMTLSP